MPPNLLPPADFQALLRYLDSLDGSTVVARHCDSACPGNPEQERRLLEQTWAEPPVFVGWLTLPTTSRSAALSRHRLSVFHLWRGSCGGDAPAARRAREHAIGPDLYNQIFTTHGTTMMFLFAVPVMAGMGIYFVPLMVGARKSRFHASTRSAIGCCCSADFSSTRFLLNRSRCRLVRLRPALRAPILAGKRADLGAADHLYRSLVAVGRRSSDRDGV